MGYKRTILSVFENSDALWLSKYSCYARLASQAHGSWMRCEMIHTLKGTNWSDKQICIEWAKSNLHVNDLAKYILLKCEWMTYNNYNIDFRWMNWHDNRHRQSHIIFQNWQLLHHRWSINIIMSAGFKAVFLSVLSYLIYTYIVLPISLPEKADFIKEKGTIH